MGKEWNAQTSDCWSSEAKNGASIQFFILSAIAHCNVYSCALASVWCLNRFLNKNIKIPIAQRQNSGPIYMHLEQSNNSCPFSLFSRSVPVPFHSSVYIIGFWVFFPNYFMLSVKHYAWLFSFSSVRAHRQTPAYKYDRSSGKKRDTAPKELTNRKVHTVS